MVKGNVPTINFPRGNVRFQEGIIQFTMKLQAVLEGKTKLEDPNQSQRKIWANYSELLVLGKV